LNNPEFVRINEKKYKINTDYRVAIDCINIAEDNSIGEYEKGLAIIYKLFGDEGLKDSNNYEDLLCLAQRYLNLDKEIEDSKEEPDMDFKQDMELIRISFMTDYNGLDIKDKEIHWWTFYNLVNGLSNSEFGNCCVLNRVRNLRNYDTSKIKDRKEREKILKAKKEVSLKKDKKKIKLTQEEEESIREFNRLMKGE
jgi:hypothetical protein